MSPLIRGVAGALVLALALPLSARADDNKKDEKKDDKKPFTLAHIKLSGSLSEKAPVSDPLFGSIGETLREKIGRLRKAATDKNVDAILLEIDGLSCGWGKLNELAQAIAHVRQSGKKVYAHVESGATKDYILGLSCDELAMPEASMLLLTGVRMEVSFYKGLFEKLGIKADFIQMGDFKGAAEPFIRDSLSEPNRKQLNSILDDFYDREIVGRIVAGRPERKMTPDQVKKLIDNGPYATREAFKKGLIDRLAYFETYPDTIKEMVKADAVKVLKDYGKKKEPELDVFSLYRRLLLGSSKPLFRSNTPRVAVIYANGPILTGKSGSSVLGGEYMGSQTIVEAIREAEKDSTVKAIVLRVDSPGGSALASDLIWNELKRSKKPVIASMADVAGSGGYYICMSAKKIYAEPGTITGSIGVVSGKLALRGLWDKAGIKTEVLARGANSGILSTEEPFSPSEKKRMTELMQDIYDQFVDKALEGRVKAGQKMTRDELLKLAGGRIYTGRQAKELGIIDEVGTLEDAITEAAKQGGLPSGKEPELLLLPKAKNPLESMLGSLVGTQTGGLKLDLKQLQPLSNKLVGVDALIGLRKEPVWAVLPFRMEVK
jgi:protease-4